MQHTDDVLGMLDTKTWLLVVDQTQARFYRRGDAESSALLLFKKNDHPEGRLRDIDLKEGKPGRSFASWAGSRRRHTMSNKLSPKEQSIQRFAKDLAGILKKARITGLFSDLILVCSPRFLGVFMANLDLVTKRRVSNVIEKDLGKLSDMQIADYFKRKAESLRH